MRPSARDALNHSFFESQDGVSPVDPPCDTFRLACKQLFPASCTSSPETLRELATTVLSNQTSNDTEFGITSGIRSLWDGYQNIFVGDDHKAKSPLSPRYY